MHTKHMDKATLHGCVRWCDHLWAVELPHLATHGHLVGGQLSQEHSKAVRVCKGELSEFAIRCF